METKLIVMCGLQCSGKSTKTKELAELYKAEILSSDYIRLQHPDWDNEKVFKNLYQLMNNLLKEDTSVIIDATNTTIKSRRQIFQNLKYNCDKMCYIMNTPYDICIERLKERNNSDYPHKFDEEVIKKYYYSFEIPFYEEGWDEIIINNIPTINDSETYINNILDKCKDFNQQNKHHTQNLDKHMNTVGSKLEGNDDKNLVRAAYLHDIGKLFTQTFKDNDPNAHYYSHANVGAYKLLCFTGIYENNLSNDYIYDYKSTLDLLFYVNYHMHMFNITTEKSEKKWRQIFGEERFNNLKLLNTCDKSRN